MSNQRKPGEWLKSDILDEKQDFITIDEYIERYHPTICRTTIGYWMQKGYISWFRPGNERFVVLTEASIDYQPNKYVGKRT